METSELNLTFAIIISTKTNTIMTTSIKHTFIILTLAINSQYIDAQSTSTEKQFYIYNTVLFQRDYSTTNFNVRIDDGKHINCLTDNKGKNIVFRTPAAMLMYFESKGWEIHSNNTTTDFDIDKGKGRFYNLNYIIIRKACTKEELETAVAEGVIQQTEKSKKKKRKFLGLW